MGFFYDNDLFYSKYKQHEMLCVIPEWFAREF